MTDRFLLIALGVLGLLAIAVAFVFRKDLARLVGKGPRWRRALFGAGLALLAPFGVGCAHGQEAEQSEKITPLEPENQDQWLKGFYPEPREPRDYRCRAPEPETESLPVDSPMSSLLADASRLSELQRQLEQLKEPPLNELPGTERVSRREVILAESESIRQRMRERCVRLEQERGANEPEPSSEHPAPGSLQLAGIETAWREAVDVLRGERGAEPFTFDRRRELVGTLFGALGAVEALVASGEISPTGGELLRMEFGWLAVRLQRLRADGTPPPVCYQPMPFPPRSQDEMLGRLVKRVPLLEQLTSREVVNPAVVSKVLESIEYDLAYILGAQARYLRMSELSEEQFCLALEWTGGGRWPVPGGEGLAYDVENSCLNAEEQELVDRAQAAVYRLRARLLAGGDEP